MTNDRAITTIVDPLPHRYVTDGPGIGGRLKVRPEDFLVEELPLYEPQGSGEHLYLRIEKSGVSHAELMSRLRGRFGVRDSEIGYAGMKDKHAITRQTVSLHLHDDPTDLDLGHHRIHVLWADRHRNKIKRGHLVGNRFSVRIREVEPTQAMVAKRGLDDLARVGVPCYFGAQRFGYRRNNHVLGAMILNGQWDLAAAELLGAAGSPFPEYQRERREHFDAGRLEEATAGWTTADRSELIVIRALCRGADARQAMSAIGRVTLNFITSALASSAFNRVLDRRIENGLIDRLVVGDLAWKHDSRAVFPVTEAELAGTTLADRLERFEISPSGPLWGQGIRGAGHAVAEVEDEARAATGVGREQFTTGRLAPEGGRRPMRAPITDRHVEGGADEHGPFIRIAFDLPRGIYATVALRELMKAPADVD